jgi:thiosulfate reductase cytochrome b subunit
MVQTTESDRTRVYLPELNPQKHLLGSLRQVCYYGYGIFKGDPNPFHVSIYRKFNQLQSMLYQVVMMLVLPIQFYTGILLWNVNRFSAQVNFFGGVRVIDTVHVVIFAFLIFYVLVHVYRGSLGHTRTAHYNALMTGYEDVEEVPAGE